MGGWCRKPGGEEREVLAPFLFKLGHRVGGQCAALERGRPEVKNVVAVGDQRYSSCGKDWQIQKALRLNMTPLFSGLCSCCPAWNLQVLSNP